MANIGNTNSFTLIMILLFLQINCTKSDLEEKYDKVKIGDSYQLVIEKIGEPCRINSNSEVIWTIYNCQNKNNFVNDNFKFLLTLTFTKKDSILVEKGIDD